MLAAAVSKMGDRENTMEKDMPHRLCIALKEVRSFVCSPQLATASLPNNCT
jgi:hypothetical protein